MKTQRTPQLPLATLPVAAACLLLTALAARADYQSTVLGDSPLAYYPLSVTVDPTGTTATDLSGNGNNGTYNGSSPQYNTVPGPSSFIPNALLFDGGSSFVDLSTGNNPSLLNFSGPITVEAWAQPANSTSFGDVIGKGYDSSTGQEIVIRVNGPYGANYYASSGSQAVSGGQQNTNWVHVVLTSDGSMTRLYINGDVVQSMADTSGSVNFSDPWSIGNGTSSGGSRFFNGNICQVAIYNHGLSSNAVITHYFMGKYGLSPSSAVPVITNQPVSQIGYTNGNAVFSVGTQGILPTTNQWYKNGVAIAGQTNSLLILSNLQASDAASYTVVSGNSNGTTNSAAATLTLHALSTYDQTIVADAPLAYYPLDGSIDTAPLAQDFSGNGNYGTYINVDPVANEVAGPSAAIPNAVAFSPSATSLVDLTPGNHTALLNFSGPISMEAWVEPADSTTFGNILAKGYDYNSYQETVLRVNGPYGANYYGSSGSAGVSGGLQTNSWTHVVLSSDGAHCSLYVNGILVQSTSDSGGEQTYNDGWAIGDGTQAGYSRYFNGNICQVAIYKHGLTTNQILQHYFLGMFNKAPSNSIPIIAVQPQPQSAYAGGSATFSVGVLGTLPTTYAWYKNSNLLSGQTNSSLVLTNLQSTDAANYSVLVGNINGTTNSAAAALTVLAAGNSLVWSSVNNNGAWDSGTTANWINVSNNNQVVFNTGDKVLFDDTPGVPTSVQVTGTVSPVSIDVNSDNNAYYFNNNNGPGSISGTGSLTKEGSSTLNITSSANFTGPVKISGGEVYAGNNCFASVSSIVVTNDSTLDIGGGGFSTGKPVTISDTGFGDAGAIINSYADYPQAAFQLALAGDAMIAGNPQRWDLVGGSVSGAHTLTVSGGGSYSMEWNTVTVAANVAGILFTNGEFGMKYLDAAFQNPATLVTVASNSKYDFWNGGFNGSLDLMPGAQVNMYNGQPLTIGSGATLFGIGSAINGGLVIGSGATLSPDVTTPIGTLNVSGNVTLGGTTVLRLNGNGVNDAVTGSTSIAYGGTLVLTNISGSPLAAGNSFQLFNSTNNTGSFTSIRPATPGTGLVWDLSQLNNGIVNVIAGTVQPVIGSTKVVNGNLIFTGSDGSASGTYYVLTSTNLALPLTNWMVLSTNQFDASGNFNVTNPISSGITNRFYLLKE